MSASNPNPSGSFNIGAATAELDSQSNHKCLKIGVVYCGDYHYSSIHVLLGIWDYVKAAKGGGTLFISSEGIEGLVKGEIYSVYYPPKKLKYYLEVNHPFSAKNIHSDVGRFTTEQCLKVVEEMDLRKWDGLVVIGENEAILNAKILGDLFRRKKVKTHVVGCRGNIDWDTCDWDANFTKVVADVNQGRSIGRFDQVCKEYCGGINGIVQDALSTEKCYHFVTLAGFASSLKTLKCALETHPNLALIGEEVFKEKKTLKQVANEIVDVICDRSKLGFNYGVILIPESLLNFTVDFLNFVKQWEKQHQLDDISESDTKFEFDYDSESCAKNLLEPKIIRMDGSYYKPVFDFDSNPDSECETVSMIERSFEEYTALLPMEPLMYMTRAYTKVVVPLEFDAQKSIVPLVKTELEKRRDYKGQFKAECHYRRRRVVDRELRINGFIKMGSIAGELIKSNMGGSLSYVKEEEGDWIHSPALLTDLLKRGSSRDGSGKKKPG